MNYNSLKQRPLTNFFTCANKAYEDFTPLFIASCLFHNDNSYSEVGVEDAAQFEIENNNAIKALDVT